MSALVSRLPDKTCKCCGKLGVRSKSLCPKCYSKEYRKTTKGKEATKRYNSTKGKDACNRLRLKRRELLGKPKVVKQDPKPICKCGALSVAVGLCRKCYNKNRWALHAAENGIKKRGPQPIDVSLIYAKVLKSVKSGMTILQACNSMGISTSIMYKRMTDIQKAELKSWKAVRFDEEEEY